MTLYEYIALLVPGVVALYALTGIPLLAAITFKTDKVGEMIVLGILAFLLGHVTQAVGRALFRWLRWRLPWLRNPKQELMRRSAPIPDPLTCLRTRWFFVYYLTHTRVARWFWNLEVHGDKPIQVIYQWLVDWPLRFISFVVIPWPNEVMFSTERIAEIKRLVQARRRGQPVNEGTIFSECFSVVTDDLRQYNLFSVQADLFRGLVVAVIFLEVVSAIFGPPLLRDVAGFEPRHQKWFLWVFGYVLLLFTERHQHFEYSAARVIYAKFLEREREGTQWRIDSLMRSGQ